MACFVTKDPDNTWYVNINWINWFAGQIDEIGGTFTLTNSLWFPDTGIVEEGNNSSDTTKQTAFFGSGGTAGEAYFIVNRISYTSSTLGAQVFTEDRTIEVRIKEK